MSGTRELCQIFPELKESICFSDSVEMREVSSAFQKSHFLCTKRSELFLNHIRIFLLKNGL